MELLKTIENNNCKVEIYPEDMDCNPRKEFDNISRMNISLGRYFEHKEMEDEEFAPFVHNPKNAPMFVFKVFGYVHSGIVLGLDGSKYPFTDRFDAGVAGYMAIEKRKLRSEFPNLKRASWKELFKKANEVAESEIEDMNTYLSGSVYCAHVVNTDTDEDNWLGCLWGGVRRDEISDMMSEVGIDKETIAMFDEEMY